MTAAELKASILDQAIRGKLVPRMGEWEITTIGESCDILDSQRKPITKKDRTPGDVPYYGASCVQDHVSGYIFDEPLVLLGEDGAKWGAGEPSAYMIDGKSWVNNHAHVLRVKDNLLREWLTLCLISFDLSDYVTGTTVPKLNQEKMRSIKIPLPPLAEQKAIVAKIEELMPLVERYGKAEERRTKLNAALPADLEKSILQEAFSGAFSGNSEFQDYKLNDVCESICTGNSLSASEKLKYSKTSGIPYIGTKDVGFDSCVNYDNGMQIPEREKGFRIAANGTSLLCVEGGSSGRKIGLLDRNVCYGNKLCAFTPCANLDPKYLFYYLQSPQFQDQFASLQKGERKGTGVSQVKSLVIPLPPIAEQKAIVAKVEELLAQVRKLNAK